MAMTTRLDAALGRQLQRDSGLSHQDYQVLVNLSESPAERMRMTELAEAMQWERSRLSHQVARMSTRGLLEREECPQDRRGVFVRLTEAGRRRLEEAAPGHVRAVRRLVFDVLSAEELGVLDGFTEAALVQLDAEAARFAT